MSGNVTSESAEAVRLLEHNLIKIQELVGASRFAYVERSVEFVVPARGGRPAQRLSGQLGDWLVRASDGGWQIQPDSAAPATARTVEATGETSEAQERSRSERQGTTVASRP